MKAQRARAQQSQHAYVRTLQNAFREVEDSLVAVQTYRSEHAARRRQVEAAANTLRLSEARYNGGVVDYLEVLDSERTLFDAALEESATRRQALVAFVTLYKALGGGWSEESEEGEGAAEDAEDPGTQRVDVDPRAPGEGERSEGVAQLE
jgi:multidrug efflux system outer membrane protein